MKQALTTTATHIHQYRAMITLALLAGCVISAFFYAINLYSLVSKTVRIGQIEKQSAQISSQLSTLDAEYLRIASAITPDEMSKYGLQKGQVSLYITRPSATAYAGYTNMSVRGHEF